MCQNPPPRPSHTPGGPGGPGSTPRFQSGFRLHHSTETVLVKIINDIRLNSDSCKISVLLDLSAAFDTVDHNIHLERLENWVRLSGMALNWFRSYLEGRGYCVSIGEHKSKWTSMTCGVPQGSILALLLFSLYMLPLSQIRRKNQIAYHSFADEIYLPLSQAGWTIVMVFSLAFPAAAYP
ncbi:hypothetical protein H4Q32_027769 [Labeo rohita]|uniref:Reverse transcriptase domain-containing protein n=1 Tax=Labeo rohita TaxID=84645 RepID=A0ABQ8MWE5_LABRO|nr:hypothetical protein H4Q32_027769 [Labeo rohita]